MWSLISTFIWPDSTNDSNDVEANMIYSSDILIFLSVIVILYLHFIIIYNWILVYDLNFFLYIKIIWSKSDIPCCLFRNFGDTFFSYSITKKVTNLRNYYQFVGSTMGWLYCIISSYVRASQSVEHGAWRYGRTYSDRSEFNMGAHVAQIEHTHTHTHTNTHTHSHKIIGKIKINSFTTVFLIFLE